MNRPLYLRENARNAGGHGSRTVCDHRFEIPWRLNWDPLPQRKHLHQPQPEGRVPHLVYGSSTMILTSGTHSSVQSQLWWLGSSLQSVTYGGSGREWPWISVLWDSVVQSCSLLSQYLWWIQLQSHGSALDICVVRTKRVSLSKASCVLATIEWSHVDSTYSFSVMASPVFSCSHLRFWLF